MKRLKIRGMVFWGMFAVIAMLAMQTPVSWASEEATHEKVRIPILTLPIGGGVYEWWASFERIFEENHPWLRVAAQETPGFVYNIKEMATNKKRWKTTIFGTSEAVTASAEHAIKPFFRKHIDTKQFKYLYPISGCGAATWFWVTLDPSIQTMEDFKGKRIGVGLRGQVNWGLWPTVALKTLKINADLEYLGPNAALEALLDGRVAAAEVNAFLAVVQPPGKTLPAIPLAALQKLLASGRKFHYVSYDHGWQARMKDEKGYTIAQPLEVKAGTLPNQKKDVIGAQALPAGWAVQESFPEDIAYEFTKFMIHNGKKLAKYNKIGQFFVIPKGLIEKYGYTEENVHPGAVRAYKEAGLWP